ncbi:hypothetical protein N24_1303 [Corynebacterium suranareeae]|uniref:Uncharacterized protein n=1 Tax=Corynebacterium suranareeae TaxID=2506452 RepID=A0A160PQ38_9CORY|nr:hypothetical protein N24_1303 [Corynebacterium suranareeae]
MFQQLVSLLKPKLGNGLGIINTSFEVDTTLDLIPLARRCFKNYATLKTIAFRRLPPVVSTRALQHPLPRAATHQLPTLAK